MNALTSSTTAAAAVVPAGGSTSPTEPSMLIAQDRMPFWYDDASDLPAPYYQALTSIMELLNQAGTGPYGQYPGAFVGLRSAIAAVLRDLAFGSNPPGPVFPDPVYPPIYPPKPVYPVPSPSCPHQHGPYTNWSTTATAEMVHA